MKKILTIAFILMLSNYSISQNSNCSGCDNSSSSITHNTNGSFTATNADAYFWEICSGNASIIRNNKTQSVSVSCKSDYAIKLTQFIDGECIESCLAVACGNDCGISIEIMGHVNLLSDGNVTFYATPQLSSESIITSSIFEITYSDLTTATYSGYLNLEGTPQIIIPVLDCQNGVIGFTATIYAINPKTGTTCSATRREEFSSVCGTDWYFNIGKNPMKNNLKIEINEDLNRNNNQNEIVIYNLEGQIKRKFKMENKNETSIDISNLKSGLYILHLIINNQLIDTKKIIISK